MQMSDVFADCFHFLLYFGELYVRSKIFWLFLEKNPTCEIKILQRNDADSLSEKYDHGTDLINFSGHNFSHNSCGKMARIKNEKMLLK